MKTERKYVFIISLGCPKNLVDTEIVAASLIQHNLGLTDSPQDADIYLINTCAFIPPARDEAKTEIQKAQKWKKQNENRVIAVCGCLPQWDEKCEFRKKFPYVDYWLGINEIEQVGFLLNSSPKNTLKISPPQYLYDHQTPRLQLTPSHFAYLKISEGCSNRCAYCSIPRIRGDLRSRLPESVLAEAENLLSNGVKELILIAQDTTAYGQDLNDKNINLSNLLKSLDQLPGDFKLRLMYAHPANFANSLISVFKDSNHLYPYVDLPLQHISDTILAKMGRKIKSTQIRKLISKLRDKIPKIAIRTTFMVGFPGETEGNFAELRNFVQETEFERLGAFTYFPEPETAGAELPNQIEPETAKQRTDELLQLQQKISLKINRQLIGKKISVLIDSVSDKTAVGRTYMDAPEIDNIVKIKLKRNQGLQTGEFVDILIERALNYQLNGKI